MRRLQVHQAGVAATGLLILSVLLISVVSWTDAIALEGAPYNGRLYQQRIGYNGNRKVFPNEKERYNVISKDVKREVDEDDGCFYDDVSKTISYQFDCPW